MDEKLHIRLHVGSCRWFKKIYLCVFRVAHPTFPVFYAEFADLESFITVILLCMKKKFDNLLILAIYRSTHFFDSVTGSSGNLSARRSYGEFQISLSNMQQYRYEKKQHRLPNAHMIGRKRLKKGLTWTSLYVYPWYH